MIDKWKQIVWDNIEDNAPTQDKEQDQDLKRLLVKAYKGDPWVLHRNLLDPRINEKPFLQYENRRRRKAPRP